MKTEEQIMEQLKRERHEADANTQAQQYYLARVAILEWVLE